MYNEMVRDRSSKTGSECLWKLEIPPKIRLFLWLLRWDRIPQSYLLHQRNTTPSPICPSCPTCVESSLASCYSGFALLRQFGVCYPLPKIFGCVAILKNGCVFVLVDIIKAMG